MKIIFLDIDGVLNGYTRFTRIWMNIASILHLSKFIHRYYDIFGVHKKYVRILSKIVHGSGAKVVVSSSWRGDWMLSDHLPNWERKASFKKWMKYYNIEVIDITPKIYLEKGDSRPLEIIQWLEDHEDIDIESYCIIDDECQELIKYFPNNVVCTSNLGLQERDYENDTVYENSGLTRQHIKEALDILNSNDKER